MDAHAKKNYQIELENRLDNPWNKAGYSPLIKNIKSITEVHEDNITLDCK